jgi:hypothetical protein
MPEREKRAGEHRPEASDEDIAKGLIELLATPFIISGDSTHCVV